MKLIAIHRREELHGECGCEQVADDGQHTTQCNAAQRFLEDALKIANAKLIYSPTMFEKIFRPTSNEENFPSEQRFAIVGIGALADLPCGWAS